MHDMLVRLYDLPDHRPALAALAAQGTAVRRALPPEKHVVAEWVGKRFSAGWRSECEASFARLPVSCFIAVAEGRILGFACYEATCRNYLGPMGVDPELRRGGVGKALLLAALDAMRADGYAYAIIGGVGPADFYAKAAGAITIPGSEQGGIYQGMLPL